MSAIRVLLCVLLLGTMVLAQDDAQRSRVPEPRRVYVPITDLEAVFERDGRGVMLPAAEYEALEAAARESEAGQPRTPDAIVLSTANYAARLDGDQLLLTATAEFTNFTEGWTRLVLPAGGLGVESATLGDQPAKLARGVDHPNVLVLYVAEKGKQTLTVELSANLSAVGSDKAAGFELFGAPSGKLTLTLPPGKHLSVGGLQLERPAPADQEAAYAIPIGGRKSLQLRITDRQAAATGDALTFAQTAFGVYVAPGEVTWTARTALQVYGRTIDTLVCTVPASLEITNVESTGLDAWELADDPEAPERTRITLRYRQPFDGMRDITFRGVVSSPSAEAWTVPDLEIRSVSSHIGKVVVQYPPGVRLQLVESAGVRPVLAATAMDPANPSLEYEVWQEDFRLSFTTAAKDREVHAAMTTLLDVNADGLDLSVTLDVRTLFAPLFDVRLRIPAEWSVTSAAIGGEPAAWQVVPAEAGINEVRIPFAAPLPVNESRSLTLSAHRDLEDWPVETDPVRFALPEVRLPQAGVVEALYGVTVDDDLEVTPIDVQGLDPARQDDVSLLNGKLQAFGRRVRLGFTYQDTVFSGQLEIARKPSRVSAATVTFFRIDRETLFGHLEAQLHIAGGGLRQLQVAVSESAGTDLRFQLIRPVSILSEPQQQATIYPPIDAVRIVEQRPAEPADGLRIWTLQLDRRARGDFVLLVDVQTPIPAVVDADNAADDADAAAAQPDPQAGDQDADAVVAAESDATAEETAAAPTDPPMRGPFSPFVLNVLNADRQSGHIAVEAGNEQHVQITAVDADGNALPTVDPVDFPPAYYRPAERVVAGFQYVRPGWSIAVTETRYDRHAVPTAIVHTAHIASVLGKTGDFQHQADLTFTAVGVQNLKVRLPKNGELWATLIDGQPVEARKSDDGVLITLPRLDAAGGGVEPRRSLRLFYRTHVGPLDNWSGRVQQSPPQLSAITGAGIEQPLEILQQHWTVHYPDDTLLVESQGRFHPERDLDRDTFLGRLEQMFRAPSPWDIWISVIAVAAAVGVVSVFTLGYQTLRSLGVVIAVLIIGAVLVALLLPATQQAREASRRTQSKNNLKQIGLALHNFHDAHGEFPEGGTFTDSGVPLHSWQTYLLPYMDQAPTFNRIDLEQPWNAPVNMSLMRQQIPAYQNPSLAGPLEVQGYGASHYAGNERVLPRNTRMHIRDITDGTSNTIFAGEVTGGIKPWGDPTNTRDPAAGFGNSAYQFSHPQGMGAHMLMMDGSVRFVSSEIDQSVLRAMATPQGGEVVGEFGGSELYGFEFDAATSDPVAATLAVPAEPAPGGMEGGGELDPFGAAPMDAFQDSVQDLAAPESGANNRVDQLATPAPPMSEPESPPGESPPQRGTATDGPAGEPGADDGRMLGTGGRPLGRPAAPMIAGPGPTVADFDDVTRYSRRAEVALAGRGALLSLTLDLQPPPGYDQREFEYHGNTTDAAPAELDLQYADRSAGRVLVLAIAAAITFFFWWLRNRSFSFRAKLALIAIIGPLALMTIAPVAWLPVLDGMFLGGLCGVGLWVLRAVVQWCAANCRCCGFGRAAAGSLALGTVWLVSATALAQENQSPVTPTPIRQEPAIIIPYEAGTDPTTSELVFLPFDQFLKLWNVAHPEDRQVGPAPVDGLVSDALYSASLEGDGDEARVSVNARYVLHNLRKRQITLPIPLGAVAVRSSTLDGEPAALSATDGNLSIVLSETGPHVLDLTFAVPARITGAAGEFTLPLRAVPAGKLSFALPAGEEQVVRVNGATGTYRIRDEAGARTVELAVDQGGDVTIAWQPRTMRGDTSAIVQLESATALNIDDAGLHLGMGLQYRVRQGQINEVTFTLPDGLSVQQIGGPDVGGWELGDDAGARTLTVFMRRAIDSETQLTLDFYKPLGVSDEAAAFSLPSVAPQNITRETGVLGLYAAQHLTLRVDASNGLSQTNLDRFTAPVLPNPPTYAPDLARAAYRFTARPIELSGTVQRRQPETRAVAEHGANVGLRKLMIASRIQYELTGAPRPAVSVVLPEGYLPIDVAATYLADWYVSGAEGEPQVLTIELDQPRTGSLEVLLEGHIVRQPDAASAEIIVPRPLSVTRLESSLAVWLDQAYTATLQTFDGWRSIDPASLSERLRTLQPRGVQFAFSTADVEPQPVALALTRATPQLSADAVTLIAVSDTSIDYGFTFRWKIARAAADTFVVTTPGWLAGRMEFNGAGIRQTSSTELEDGRIRWTIALVDPVSTEYLLTAVATLPPPADDTVQTPLLNFEQPAEAGTFAPLETQTQHAVLVNLSGLQLSPVDAAQIDPVSRDELPLTLRSDLLDQAMEIVRVRAERVPSWGTERLQQAETATATVTAAEMISVLDYDGSWRMQAVYTVRNRGRQFLALRIPEGARILSVYVRGVPSRTVQTSLGSETVQLVALPQTSAADLSFEVKLVLAGRLTKALPENFMVAAREIELPSPSVVTREEAQAAGRPDLGMPVVHTQWTVYLPDDIDASAVDRKSNLSFDQEAWDLQIRKQEQDAVELTRMLFDPLTSSRQKVQVLNNLKQLDVSLEQQSSNLTLSTDTEGVTKLYARNEALQQQVDEAIAKYEQSEGAAQQSAEDRFGVTAEQEKGRAFVAGNTAAIVTDNRGSAGQSEDGAALGLNFRYSAPADPSQQPMSESRSGEVAGRSDLKKQLADQSLTELAEEQQRARTQRQSGAIELPPPVNHIQYDEQSEFRQPEASQQRVGPPINYVDRESWNDRTVAGMLPASDFAPQVDFEGDGVVDTAGMDLPAWTSTGGLSLSIDVPVTESKLVFSKVGGEPRLVLAVRPRRALTLGVGFIWTVLWIIAGIWLLRLLGSDGASGRFRRAVPKVLIGLGLIGFFLVPGPVRWLLFAIFVAGAIGVAVQRRTAIRTAS